VGALHGVAAHFDALPPPATFTGSCRLVSASIDMGLSEPSVKVCQETSHLLQAYLSRPDSKFSGALYIVGMSRKQRKSTK